MWQSAEARPLTVVAELLGLGSVAALLVGAHALVPATVHEQFVFGQSLARPETLLTAAYLHISDGHLSRNLLGYALVALYTYAVCLAAGERQWFWFTTLSMLLVVPILVNVSSMTVWTVLSAGADIPPSQGFSGVVAGFCGFLVVALLVSLRGRHSPRTVWYVGRFVLLVVVGELLVIYTELSPLVGGGFVLLGLGLVGVGVATHAYPEGWPRDRGEWLAWLGSVTEAGLVVVVLAVLVAGLFPGELLQNGMVTNVVAHLSGLVWGAVVSRWGYRYWGGRG